MPKKSKPRKDLNNKAADSSGEFVRNFFLTIGVAVLVLWVVPHLGVSSENSQIISQDRYQLLSSYSPLPNGSNYVSLFEFDEWLDGPQVAGAVIESRQVPMVDSQNSRFYSVVSQTGQALGAFWDESVNRPFSTASSEVFARVVPEIAFSQTAVAVRQAGNEVFDISSNVEPYVEFFKPGVSAVWNAWLELMADPEF